MADVQSGVEMDAIPADGNGVRPDARRTSAVARFADPGSMSMSTRSLFGEMSSSVVLSSMETSRIKRRQRNRLATVKKRTMAVVFVKGLFLLMALSFQIVWLNEALDATFDHKVRDLFGYFPFRYQEQLSHLAQGAQLYNSNTSTTSACQSLTGNESAQLELQRRFGNDVRGRKLEIGLVTDTSGIIFGTSGHRSGLGYRFNPQDIVTRFHETYPQTTSSLQASVMIRPDLLSRIGARRVSAGRDRHPELRTWTNFTENLTRVVLTPLYCGQARIQGYQIWGDVWTPRQYDRMNRLVLQTSSSMVSLFARTTTGTWQTQYSYNKVGETGWGQPFPDLVPYLDGDVLDDAFDRGGTLSGEIQLGGVMYRYAMAPIPSHSLGHESVPEFSASPALILYAEPESSIKRVVNTALSWHVPFGLFTIVVSFLSLNYTFRKYLNPMQLLLESLRIHRLKEFNDRIRQMRQSRATLWVLLTKALLIQAALMLLIFINRWLLTSNMKDFTSATTQGRIGPYVTSTNARSLMRCLSGWSGFASVIQGVSNNNITLSLRNEITERFKVFPGDALYLLSRESKILASTHRAAEGSVFPEVGIMDYFTNQAGDQIEPFTTLTSWHPTYVNLLTPFSFTLQQPPALIRLAIAPVRHIIMENEQFVADDVVGAIVLLRILNGYDALWNSIHKAFGQGFYGLYSWDRFHDAFTPISTSFVVGPDLKQDFDLIRDNPNLLLNGINTVYMENCVMAKDSVNIGSLSSTVSIAPFFQPGDDVVLTPLVLNAYQVTGAPQDHFDVMLAHQLAIQSLIMAVEFLASMLALACAYWPMKRFLDNLEQTFRVPSLSSSERRSSQARREPLLSLQGRLSDDNNTTNNNNLSEVSLIERRSD